MWGKRKGVSLLLEILIFSDSHGNVAPMRRAIAAHPEAKYVLFCGDGLRDIETVEEAFPEKIFLSVRGNCDLFLSTDTPTERVFTLGGRSILLTHGHLLGVKGSYGVAASHAHDAGAELLIFGHTHLPYEGRMETGDGVIHLFNPGSIGRAYGGAYSYGILTVGDNGYLFSHGSTL